MDKSPVWGFKPEPAGQMGRLAMVQTGALLLPMISCMKAEEFLKKSSTQDLKHLPDLQVDPFTEKDASPAGQLRICTKF